MPTQIIPTPVLKGEEAYKVYLESQRKTTPEAEAGAKILAEKFEKLFNQK